MFKEIIIEFATKDDITQIEKIIFERCLWLKNKNIKQWDIVSYPNWCNNNYLINAMNTENLFVAKEKGKVIGAVLLKSTDFDYWEKEDYQSFYIHHLVTKENYQGLGKIIIDFCIKFAVSNGKKYLRLDCREDNNKLNDYYESLGFVLKGKGYEEEDDYRYNLREKKLKIFRSTLSKHLS